MNKEQNKSVPVTKSQNVKIVLKLEDLREIIGGSTAGSTLLTEGVVPPPAATIMCP